MVRLEGAMKIQNLDLETRDFAQAYPAASRPATGPAEVLLAPILRKKFVLRPPLELGGFFFRRIFEN